MKGRIGRVMGSKNAWILLWLLNSKFRELRNAGVRKKGGHDCALSGVNIVLQDFCCAVIV